MEKQPNGPFVPEHTQPEERWVQDVLDFYLTDMDEAKRDELKMFFRTVGLRAMNVYDYQEKRDGERQE